MTIDFGWEIPTGRRRMPGAAATYEAHLRRVLDHLSGHFHSAWMPDHFVDNHLVVPEALISLSYLAGRCAPCRHAIRNCEPIAALYVARR